jgi:diacylglycerol kinase (ATP)
MKPKSWLQSANVAIDGIIYAVKTQRHMRYHLCAALTALLLGLALNISRLEFTLLCSAIILVLVTELLNTAIETTVDMICEEFHPKAKLAKDIAAGVVLTASIGSLMLAYLILYPGLKTAVMNRSWHLTKAPDDVIAFVSLATVMILVIFIKALVGKGEPLQGGMPSGHAAVSFSIWIDTFYLIGSPSIVILTFLLATAVSWSRWSMGIHRPLEVGAGAFLGCSVTFLLFRIFG